MDGIDLIVGAHSDHHIRLLAETTKAEPNPRHVWCVFGSESMAKRGPQDLILEIGRLFYNGLHVPTQSNTY